MSVHLSRPFLHPTVLSKMFFLTFICAFTNIYGLLFLKHKLEYILWFSFSPKIWIFLKFPFRFIYILGCIVLFCGMDYRKWFNLSLRIDV